VVRTVVDALAGDRIEAIGGVLNGTCTAILSSMESGGSYASALDDARAAGFAEAEPANDVEGIDAAHKLAILMQDAFGLAIVSPRIRRRGITSISPRDIELAAHNDSHIRLIAAAVRCGDRVAAEVGPMCVPASHAFARTAGAENVVEIRARDAGRLVLRGIGAGGAATASAVLGDLDTTIRTIGRGRAATGSGSTEFPSPALDVVPLFPTLDRFPELPQYPIWNDACFSDVPEDPESLSIVRSGAQSR
jgi:homoserine dehydrogenase